MSSLKGVTSNHEITRFWRSAKLHFQFRLIGSTQALPLTGRLEERAARSLSHLKDEHKFGVSEFGKWRSIQGAGSALPASTPSSP